MAQARVLHRQGSYNDPCLLRQSFSQPQPSLDYSFQASRATDQFGSLTFAHTTAQAMLQHQYRPASHLLSSTWPFQQALSREQTRHVAAPPDPTPNNGNSSQNQFWGGSLAFGNDAIGWPSALPTKPFVMSEPEYHYLRNSDLSYNHMAAQAAMGKGGNIYGGHGDWLASGSNAIVGASDLDTNNSHSPNSYLNGNPESETYSPRSMLDQTSSGDDWNRYATPFPCVKESSSTPTSPELHFVSVPTQKTEDVGESDLSGLPQMGISSEVTAGSSFKGDEWPGTHDDTHETGSEYSYSHGSSAGASPWYQPGISYDFSDFPPRRQDLHLNHIRGSNPSSISFPQLNTRQQTTPWSDSRVGVPSRSMLQDRFQVPRSVDTQGQRKLNDDILIQGKQDGLTYKEIRKMMVGERPAESTLRGRYRSLTKARKDRVRKPVWTKRDIELLNEFVDHEFDRIESTLSHPQALGLVQKLVKVQWKKVADYIDDQGGSYHFGNSTCKRKWLEINKGS
ncbi:Nn.00g033240.m01.CDS01 [Neocucurbitaria sp. VM-36]